MNTLKKDGDKVLLMEIQAQQAHSDSTEHITNKFFYLTVILTCY